jgi:hypothetical protein
MVSWQLRRKDANLHLNGASKIVGHHILHDHPKLPRRMIVRVAKPERFGLQETSGC